MSDLRICLLGPPLFIIGHRNVEIGRRKVAALLAYLAVTNQRHSRDELSELLFSRLPRDHARASLRQTLSYARAAIGAEWLQSDRLGIWMYSKGDCQIDVATFQQSISSAQTADAQADISRSLNLYSQAADLYRGDFLSGFYIRDSFAFEEWQLMMQDNYRSRLTFALRRLVDLHSGSSQYERAIEYSQRIVAIDPYDEENHQLLIKVFLAAGRSAEARRQYERCKTLLRRELDEEPSDQLEALCHIIGEKSHPAGMSAQSHPKPVHSDEVSRPRKEKGNVKIQPTSFIGRVKELNEIFDLFNKPEVRLVTLVGTGGSGKTRLAFEVAARSAVSFSDGVFAVDLGTVSDPDEVPHAIATSLGIADVDLRRKPMQNVLAEYLEGKQIALIIDNFEHLSVSGPFIADMLTTCRELKILVTSRESLHLQAEKVVPVMPLSLPAPHPSLNEAIDSDAVKLMVARAQSLLPSFELTKDNVEDIAEICIRLEGLPLAIELAVPRLRILTPKTLLAKLGKRLDMLVGGSRDLPERQRTLKSEIEWSFDLLSDAERRIFTMLSVFTAGCTIEAAEDVCRSAESYVDIFACLSSLVDKSLLSIEHSGDETRFTMLESLREYASEKLLVSGGYESTIAMLSDYYLRFCEAVELNLYGPSQSYWMKRIDDEYPNIRSVLSVLHENRNISQGLRVAGALGWYWFRRAHFNEGLYWLGLFRGAAKEIDLPSMLAKTAYYMGWIHLFLGSVWGNPRGKKYFEESRRLWRITGNARGVALSQVWLAWNMDDMETESDWAIAEESVRIARDTDDPWALSLCLKVAYANLRRPDKDAAYRTQALEESIELAKETDDPFLLSQALTGMADVYNRIGDTGEALRWYADALEIANEIEDTWSMLYNTYCLAEGNLRLGNDEQARTLLSNGLRHARDRGVRGYLAWFAGGFYMLERNRGRGRRALRLGAFSESILNPNCMYDARVAEGLGMNSELAETEWSAGLAMSVEDAVAFALSDEGIEERSN